MGIVGRGGTVDLRVDDPTVSSAHCELRAKDGGVLVRTTDEYPVLHLNAAAWDVLHGQRPVRLRQAPAAAKTAQVEEDAEKFQIMEIPFDRWGASSVVQTLEKMNLKVIQFGQGYQSMSPPMKELERLVASHKIAHGNNPVLTWMADNLIALMDPAGNIKPDKKKSKEKIDGVVAMLMGLDRALRNQGETGKSVYDEHGIVTF